VFGVGVGKQTIQPLARCDDGEAHWLAMRQALAKAA